MNVFGHALAGEYTSQIGLADTYCSAVSSDPRIKSFRLIGQSAALDYAATGDGPECEMDYSVLKIVFYEPVNSKV